MKVKVHCSDLRVSKVSLKKAESGDYSEKVTPVPIPNTEVKLLRADDTWWATAWESRSLPVQQFFLQAWLRGQAVKTPPFHGGNSSSILDGVTIFLF
jgi:hypothetical protein